MGRLITGSHPACADVCRALGLEPLRVAWLNLNMSPDSFVTVTVELAVGPEQLTTLARIFRTFELVERRDTHDPPKEPPP